MRIKKIRPVKNLGGVLEKIIKDLGIAGQVKLIRLMAQWDKIIGPPMSKVSFPRDLKGKTLFLTVGDSVWLQQLSFMDKMMLEKINKNFGSKIVNQIRFSVGPLPDRLKDLKGGTDSPLDQITLDNEDMDAVVDLVKDVSDPELKKDLRRIIAKDIKLKKHREKLAHKEVDQKL